MNRLLRTLAILSVLALALVGVRSAGLISSVGTLGVRAEFADAAGLGPRAEVAYRGFGVGRVARLTPTEDGVLVELRLDRDARIPAGTRAVVATRSAVGERYVDLRPDSGSAPFLRDGDVIPRERTSGPLTVEALLVQLGGVVSSIGAADLTVVVDELARAFDGTGPALGRLIDDQRLLLAAAEENLPHTLALLRDGATVLSRQAGSATAMREWADDLAAVSGRLRAGDAELRTILTNGPASMGEATALVRRLSPSTGFLASNLIVLGRVQGHRLDGLQQILATFPAVVRQGQRMAPGDGTAHLGLVLSTGGPTPCMYRAGARSCTDAQLAAGSGVRSDRRVPHADDRPDAPAHARISPTSADSTTGPDFATSDDGGPLQLGSTGGQLSALGAASWKALLLGPLAA